MIGPQYGANAFSPVVNVVSTQPTASPKLLVATILAKYFVLAANA